MSDKREKLPLVTIVIPVYNQERFIEETIGYIINQTYSNWELILVDDLSTDNTRKIIEKSASFDQRIHLLIRNREPKGAQTCRNTGIDNSRGEYIILFDSDDIIRPHCLEQRVKYMKNHPDIDFGIFRGASYNQLEGKVVDNNKWGVDPGGDVLPFFLEANYPFGVWNVMFKTEVAVNTKYDEVLQIYQDFDFIVSAILKNYTYSFDKESTVDYLYRQGHTGAITSSFISEGKYDSTKYLFSKTMKEIESLENYKELRKHFFGFFRHQLKKVAMDGTKQQINDYFKFVFSYYSFPYSVKIRIIKLLLHGPILNHRLARTKFVNFIFALLYSPSDIFSRLFRRK